MEEKFGLTGKLILGLTGMPGSGKSVAVRVAMQRNYESVVMGDVVRKEARRRGLKPTPQNIGKTMLELRHKEGPAVISKRCIPKIKEMPHSKLIIDGIRSLKEVEEFEKHFQEFTLLGIHSSPKTRFIRLHNRRRTDDPKNWEIFRERDMRELGVGLGNTLAMAEFMIVNEKSLQAFKERVKKTLKRIEEQWME